MIIYFKDFILNVFFICTPLLLYPYIYRQKNNVPMYRLLLFMLFAFAILMSLSLPINLNGLIYDFRSIPLTLGFLYGGAPVSALLYVTLGFVRFFSGPNGLQYMISLIPSFVMVIYTFRKYNNYRVSQKILYAVVMCSLIKLFTFATYLYLTDNLALLLSAPLIATIETYLIQGLLVGCCVYFIEFMNKYFLMQEEIAKSEKMKIVSDMAASVAHEIRNPLTTVRGFIQFLGTDNPSAEKREFYKTICLEELDRAQLIISDYLTLAKPDPEHVERISINQEISYVSNVLQTYANFNNIQIHVKLDGDYPIMGDRYKFRQALINIGKNAIEAMPNSGLLTFEAHEAQDTVEIQITDTGIGMTSEQIARLGTPFFSSKEKGTGLGTMVSFGIIKKMDGKIVVNSTVGHGTTYKITFPAANGIERGNEAHEISIRSSHGTDGNERSKMG